MIYVFDTSAFIPLFTYFYPKRFPTLWKEFDQLVEEERIISTKENFREIQGQNQNLLNWAKENKHIFLPPDSNEAQFVTQIYSVPHFRNNIEQQKLYKGGFNADPFVIAKAYAFEGTVVTSEQHKPHAAKIPNICQHFGVPCFNLESFMENENWSF